MREPIGVGANKPTAATTVHNANPRWSSRIKIDICNTPTCVTDAGQHFMHKRRLCVVTLWILLSAYKLAHLTVMTEQAFFEELHKYQLVLQMTAGCGERGQYYVEEQYKELKQAYDDMDADLQAKHKMPKKINIADDGTGGIATGISHVVMGNVYMRRPSEW